MLRYYVSYVYSGTQGKFGAIVVERELPISSGNDIRELQKFVMDFNHSLDIPLILGFSRLEDVA